MGQSHQKIPKVGDGMQWVSGEIQSRHTALLTAEKMNQHRQRTLRKKQSDQIFPPDNFPTPNLPERPNWTDSD
jgi:hypothetical protein